MRKFIIFTVLLINSIIGFSQSERINWIIFIDGKIPQSTVLTGEFICFEGMPKEKVIKFEYLVGDIQISEEDFRYIKENGESLGLLKARLFYREFEKHTRNLYIYSFEIAPRLLLPIYDYVVLRITNINKKKGIFYLGYSTSYESTPWLNKESQIFKEIYTETPQRGINSKEIKMRRINVIQ